MHISLILLGPFRSCAVGADQDGAQKIELVPEARLSEVLLRVDLPADVPRVVLLNGIQRSDDPQLHDGDIITVFAPIAGGCPGSALSELSAGTGLFAVRASLQRIGPDLLIAVKGGTHPHIGALAVATPHTEHAPEQDRSSRVLQFSFPGHRDDVIASRVAERVAAAVQRTVVVSAGIHIPEITPSGIENVLANTDCLIEKIITSLRSRVYV